MRNNHGPHTRSPPHQASDSTKEHTTYNCNKHHDEVETFSVAQRSEEKAKARKEDALKSTPPNNSLFRGMVISIDLEYAKKIR